MSNSTLIVVVSVISTLDIALARVWPAFLRISRIFYSSVVMSLSEKTAPVFSFTSARASSMK